MKRAIFLVLIVLLHASCRDRHVAQHKETTFVCIMHPEVTSDSPGTCPKCGMTLVRKENQAGADNDVQLETLLKPTNEFVVAKIPLTQLTNSDERILIESLGKISYDTKETGIVSARVAGRIEKLYVRYRYQKVRKGQRLFDIYSPELVTAQQNLLFLLQNDASNRSLIESAKEKLLFLGMSSEQLAVLTRTGKPILSISVFSNYDGHIHEAGANGNMSAYENRMKDISLLTEELPLKEGMYVQRGQPVFAVFNPASAWAILNIYGSYQSLIKKGNPVQIIPETAPDRVIQGQIDFIEPFFEKDSKTLTVRVFFDNSRLSIPIGSQVKATISTSPKNLQWLPGAAVVSLGIDKVVFVKSDGGFRTQRVTTGISFDNKIEILSGLPAGDSVAANAQFLMDSESFIKIASHASK